MERLSPIGEYHLRNTSHDFDLVCFLARRRNVHVLFLQRLSKCARTNYMRVETNFGLTEPAESLRVPSGCYLSLGYSRSRSVCPKHTVKPNETLRTYMACCLFLVSAFVSGCATTATYEQQMREREEKVAWDSLSVTKQRTTSRFVSRWRCMRHTD